MLFAASTIALRRYQGFVRVPDSLGRAGRAASSIVDSDDWDVEGMS
jgi:hypothetical protein